MNSQLLAISHTGISEHCEMLNDFTRTKNLIAGIQEVVKQGDVVADIGTGTGVLAIAAAKAGAKKVYAIEASSIARIAQGHFEANGLGDKISLIPGWSFNITLPEKVDVLISETIGHEPLQENILEITIDAGKRLLKSEGIIIPKKLKIFGIPLNIPQDILNKHTATITAVETWQKHYKVDFSVFAIGVNQTSHYFLVSSYKTQNWQTFAEPMWLMDIDLKQNQETNINIECDGIATTSGLFNGVLMYFELDITPTIKISTHPLIAQANCSWQSPCWMIPAGLDLDTGQKFKIIYRRSIKCSEIIVL